MQPDLGIIFLACAVIGVAVVLAVVTGTLAARIFFNASRRETDEAIEPSTKRSASDRPEIGPVGECPGRPRSLVRSGLSRGLLRRADVPESESADRA